MTSGSWPRTSCTTPVTVQVNPTAPARTVSHALYPVEQHLKTDLLLALAAPYRHEVGPDLHPHQAPRQARGRAAGKGRITGPHRCRATCPRTSARRRSTGSGTARIRSWWPPTSPPAASMSPASPTSSTMTCPTPPMPIPTASAVPAARQKSGDAFTFVDPGRRRHGAQHRAGPR